MKRKRATELEFLKWYFSHADFGPAHSDVLENLLTWFVAETGKMLPDGYNHDASGEINEFGGSN